MDRPTDAQLRALARINDQEMDRRIDHHAKEERGRVDAQLGEMRAWLEQQEERIAELERLQGIEHHELPNIAYDGLASGDQGVVWDDFEFDQSLHPKIAKRMIDREGYGHR